MSLPTKAVLHAATFPRKPEPGSPCNISIEEFNRWLADQLRQAQAEGWDEGHWGPDCDESLISQGICEYEHINPYRSKP